MSSAPDQSARSVLRQQRLKEIEREQLLEDLEALRMTEEQRQALLQSFHSVKAEFSDLDGLHWTGTALHRRTHVPQLLPPHSHLSPSRRGINMPPPPSSAFAVLTNADLQTFAPSDTIRAPTSCLIQRPQIHPVQYPPPVPRRQRSPVKGLFNVVTSTGDVGEVYHDENHLRGRPRRPPSLRSSPNHADGSHYISYSSSKSECRVVESNDSATSDEWGDYDDGLKTPVPSQRLAFNSEVPV